MKSRVLADADDLERWADTLEARSVFPELIRRLVHATGRLITHSSFPAGKSVQLPGWDGTLVCEEATAFTPGGASGWEFGTSSGVREKADEDYEKRTADSAGLNRDEATFVFATPRVWTKRDEWVEARLADKRWRGVRAYDARSLEEWLLLAPAVHVWLSRLIGKRPEGGTDLETWWSDWSGASNPPLPHGLLLASRDGPAERARRWIEEIAPAPLVVQADTRDEVVAFFASVIESLPDADRIRVLARVVVVDDEEAWDVLLANREPLILVPTFDSAEGVAKGTRRGHLVLLPKGRGDAVPVGETVILKRIRRRDAAEALVAAGVERERAERLADQARAGLASMRRQLSHAPEPAWANANNARVLIPAMLAGSWDDNSSADRACVEKLAGQEYQRIRMELVRLANQSDPAVRHVGDTWTINNKEDAWRLLTRFFVREPFEAFVEAATEILGLPDPKFELAEDQQWLASLHGKVLPHSKWLREGLADTAALLGTRGVTPIESRTAQEYAERLAGRVLDIANTNWQVWASLSSLIPLLAEAAPDVVLTALDIALSGPRPLIRDLFRDAKHDDGWFSSSPHTGILFALEILARSTAHAGGAALLLARLATLDPGGKLGNRPKASLRELFLPWFPQIAADVDRRLEILNNIRAREPEVAWQLMVDLLPRTHDHSSNTPVPKWRDWSVPERREINLVEYWREIHEIIGRLVADVGTSGARWSDLIAALDNVSPEEHELIVNKLNDCDVAGLSPGDRAQVADALRGLVATHRSSPGAKWALPADVVARIASLYETFESPDLVRRHAYLFSDRPQLLDGRERDWEEQQKRLEAARTSAVEAVYGARGLAGILELATKVTRAHEVGAALGVRGVNESEEDAVLQQHLAGDGAIARLGAGYCVGRVCAVGRGWVEAKLRGAAGQWSPTHRAALLLALPADEETWELAEREGLEVDREYWRRVFPWIRDGKGLGRAVTKLVQHDRPYTAVHLVGLHHAGKERVSPDVAALALEAAMKSDAVHDRPDGNFGYHATELLSLLAAEGFDEQRLATLEWNYLPLFRTGERGGGPHILQRVLSRSPQFFVELLSAAFRGEGEEPRDTDEATQRRARHAYELLDDWRTIPGEAPDGTIDVSVLKGWVEEARRLAAAAQRARVGDSRIGHMLSASPPGSDGAWPHESVRDVIDDVRSPELERGIAVGKRNARGPVWRKPGGDQEDELARQFDKFAETCADRWPRTAGMLRDLAKQYRGEARWHDNEEELD